jgi:hypothetical protein
LINAGVPEEVLWAPVRVVATSAEGSAEIQDKLWLPTLWEMTGNNDAKNIDSFYVNPETEENQASLEYYKGQNNPNR